MWVVVATISSKQVASHAAVVDPQSEVNDITPRYIPADETSIPHILFAGMAVKKSPQVIIVFELTRQALHIMGRCSSFREKSVIIAQGVAAVMPDANCLSDGIAPKTRTAPHDVPYWKQFVAHSWFVPDKDVTHSLFSVIPNLSSYEGGGYFEVAGG